MSIKYNPDLYNWKALDNNDLKRLVKEVLSTVPSPEWAIRYNKNHIVFTIRSGGDLSDGLSAVFQAKIELNEDSLNVAMESSQNKRHECGWSSWLAGRAMTEFLQFRGLEVLSNLKTVNGKEDNYQAIADLMWEYHGGFTADKFGI
jgi:hypothetical protein